MEEPSFIARQKELDQRYEKLWIGYDSICKAINVIKSLEDILDLNKPPINESHITLLKEKEKIKEMLQEAHIKDFYYYWDHYLEN